MSLITLKNRLETLDCRIQFEDEARRELLAEVASLRSASRKLSLHLRQKRTARLRLPGGDDAIAALESEINMMTEELALNAESIKDLEASAAQAADHSIMYSKEFAAVKVEYEAALSAAPDFVSISSPSKTPLRPPALREQKDEEVKSVAPVRDAAEMEYDGRAAVDIQMAADPDPNNVVLVADGVPVSISAPHSPSSAPPVALHAVSVPVTPPSPPSPGEEIARALATELRSVFAPLVSAAPRGDASAPRQQPMDFSKLSLSPINLESSKLDIVYALDRFELEIVACNVHRSMWPPAFAVTVIRNSMRDWLLQQSPYKDTAQFQLQPDKVWQDIRALLERHLAYKTPRVLASAQYESLRHAAGQSVVSFAVAFHDLASRAGRLSDFRIGQEFLRRLPHPIAQAAFKALSEADQKGPDAPDLYNLSFEHARAAAIAAERRLEAVQHFFSGKGGDAQAPRQSPSTPGKAAQRGPPGARRGRGPNDLCHRHAFASHTNAECFLQLKSGPAPSSTLSASSSSPSVSSSVSSSAPSVPADTGARSSRGPTCSYCKRVGHTVERCWTKNPDMRPAGAATGATTTARTAPASAPTAAAIKPGHAKGAKVDLHSMTTASSLAVHASEPAAMQRGNEDF